MSPARTTTTTAQKPKGSSKTTTAPRKLGARARARRQGIDSDDEEMERHVVTSEGTGSDLSASESEDDDDDDEEEDSDVESDAESGLSAGRSHPDTPNTNQSPPPGDRNVTATALNGKDGNEAAANLKGPAVVTDSNTHVGIPSFLEPTKDWSEMVTQEGLANGDGQGSELPVIEFSEMHVHAAEEEEEDVDSAAPGAVQDGKDDGTAATGSQRRSTVSQPRSSRGRGFAHALYQQNLKNPAYTPRVGPFWGHDDRLYDPELRPLSGWWRGDRFRGRRGFVRGRGRGRGGFGGGDRNSGATDREVGEGDEHAEDGEHAAPELPPVERTWTHDGFEEMKSRDERRRAQIQQERKENGARSPQQWGGRGGFAPRGFGAPFNRGAGRGFARGRGTPYAYHHHHHYQHMRSQSVQSERTWFVQKPERFWTKQLEGYLFADHDLKARPGRGVGYRVHLPGKGSDVIRSPVSAKGRHSISTSRSMSEKAPSEIATETDRGSERKVVVKLPKAIKDTDQETKDNISMQESVTIVEQPLTGVTSTENVRVLEDRSQTEYNGATATVDEQARATPSLLTRSSSSPSSQEDVAAQPDMAATPGLMLNGTYGEQVNGPDFVVAQPAPMVVEAIMGNGMTPSTSSTATAPPIIPPVQPVYSPSHSQPSPTTYGMTYVYADNSALSPGMAAYHHQMASNGQPIYLQQATPPPPPVPTGMQLYAPHTHAMGPPPPPPFVPSHMHHHSLPAVPAEFMTTAHHHPHAHHAHNLGPHGSTFQRYPNAGTPPLVGGMGVYGAGGGGGGSGGGGGVFIDPATGQPLFSLPRQNSRIEIRKPGEFAAGEGKKGVMSTAPSGMSGLGLSNGVGVESIGSDGVEDAGEQEGEERGEDVREGEESATDAIANNGGEVMGDDMNGNGNENMTSHIPTHTDGPLPHYASTAAVPEFYPRPMSMSMPMSMPMSMSMSMPMMAAPYEEGAYRMQPPEVGGMMEYGYGYAPQGYYYPEAYYPAAAATAHGPGVGYPTHHQQQQQRQGAYDPYTQEMQPVYY